jgi:DNA-binding transcriptional MerR regulator
MICMTSPVTTPETLTVGQIAALLVRLGCTPDVAGTTERLRHWTREGFIHPVASHHEGTGKHRRYTEDAVFDALVLNAFADVGIQIAAKRHLITDALVQAKAAWREWPFAVDPARGPFTMVIRHRVGRTEAGWGRTDVECILGRPADDDPADTMTIRINLGQIFRILYVAGIRQTDSATAGGVHPVESDAPGSLIEALKRAMARGDTKDDTDTDSDGKKRRARR